MQTLPVALEWAPRDAISCAAIQSSRDTGHVAPGTFNTTLANRSTSAANAALKRCGNENSSWLLWKPDWSALS